MSIKDDILNNYDDEVAYQLDADFIKKYGFSLFDFETELNSKNILSDNYVCYGVKNLAYKIADEFYGIIDENYDIGLYIDYKLVAIRNSLGGFLDYIHRIAFGYKDLIFLVDIQWVSNVLNITDWDLISESEYEQLKGFEDIDIVLDDEEDY